MKLLNLNLENFRSYSTHRLDFDQEEAITIFVGQNGLGKTNLLEAIYLLSLGRSFRSSHQDDLVLWDQDYARCQGQIQNQHEEFPLEIFIARRPLRRKNFKVKEVNRRQSNYIGHLLTVLFHPEDLNMLYLSPTLRRQYLDTVLCQTDRQYLEALSNYRKTLKQRNALLSTIREAQFQQQNTTHLSQDLDIWDQKISEFGSQIIEKREKFVNFLQKQLQELYQHISDGEEQVTVEYQSKIQGDYLATLQDRRQKDLYQAKTTAGPHRDDLIFYINEKEINSSASRGEFRTLLLAIKLAEIHYIKEITKENPVLLLDDVFSELDPHRQKKLLDAIGDCQTIITTTEIHDGMEKIARIVKLEA